MSTTQQTKQLQGILIQAIEAAGFQVSGPTDSRAAEHGEPAWVCNARAAIAELATPSVPESMTGLMISLDDGESWQPSNGIRVMFHDANETDEGMEDLMVNVTTEGVILDLLDQASGEVSRTAPLLVDSLIGLTQ